MSVKIKECYKTVEELYLDNKGLVKAYASDYTREESIRDEICSIVWAKFLENVEKYSLMHKHWVKCHLRIVARNAVADYFKSEVKEKEKLQERAFLASDNCNVTHMEKEIFHVDRIAYLKRAMQILTPEQKELLRLKYIEKKHSKEIGELLGMSDSAVRTKQKRTLSK